MFRFGDPGGRMYTNIGASSVNMLALWTTGFLGSNGGVSAGNGRSGGSSLRFAQANGALAASNSKTLDAQATWGVACALKVSVLVGQATAIIQFVDGASVQCDLRLNPDGTLTVTRNGTALGSTSGAVTISNYVHIEFKVTIHPTAGTVDVWINGASRLSLTGQNTRATSNSSANVINLGLVTQPNISGAYTYDFDDIIVYDGQATDANGFPDITGPIGDCGLVWLLPTGAGTTTQFTPDSGVNYARINETTPDGDTSYVSDANVGDIDTYAIADLPVNVASVKSVAACHYARKTDTASRSIAAELRSGGTNYSHAAQIFLGTNYQYDFSNWGANPNTSAAWTVAGVNALEVGQKIAS
jgi:hypothetical protein